MRRSRMLVAMVLAVLGLMAAGCSQPAKPAPPCRMPWPTAWASPRYGRPR